MASAEEAPMVPVATASPAVAGAPGPLPSSAKQREAGEPRDVSPHADVAVDDDGMEGAKLTVADRECWRAFRAALVLFFVGLFAFCLVTLNFRDAILLYSAEYFVACAIGGAIGGTPHLVVVPIDLLKCRTQVGEYTSLTEGLALLRKESAAATSFGEKVDVWFRGWFPTLMGYTTQGAAKFGLYELFKYLLASSFSYEFAAAHLTAIFIVAAAAAELLADCFLAPWEAVKVRLQTSRQFPPVMRVVMPRMWSIERWRGYFKGLPALWARQIPYTIVKFATFENTVRFLVRTYASATGAPTPNTGPIFLMLTVTGGYIAGALCATVSHPADTVISKMNSKHDAGRVGIFGMLVQMPCREIWRGWALRVTMVGTLTALQWIGYDGFKFMVGLPTTGRGGHGSVGDGVGNQAPLHVTSSATSHHAPHANPPLHAHHDEGVHGASATSTGHLPAR